MSKNKENTNPSVAAASNSKRVCGLCGFSGNRNVEIVKTECCDNWICDDQHKYSMFSHRLNSCARNHERFTSCGSHFVACDGQGKWQDCQSCNYPVDPSLAAWSEFCNKHFNFENVTAEIKELNMKIKKDPTAKACAVPKLASGQVKTSKAAKEARPSEPVVVKQSVAVVRPVPAAIQTTIAAVQATTSAVQEPTAAIQATTAAVQAAKPTVQAATSAVEEPAEKVSGMVECSECGRPCKGTTGLATHMRSHKNKKAT